MAQPWRTHGEARDQFDQLVDFLVLLKLQALVLLKLQALVLLKLQALVLLKLQALVLLKLQALVLLKLQALVLLKLQALVLLKLQALVLLKLQALALLKLQALVLLKLQALVLLKLQALVLLKLQALALLKLQALCLLKLQMTSAALGAELKCAICWSLYTEPVSLTCGHIFCHNCIGTALDTQERPGGAYTCPECRKKYPERPLLEKNRKLSNIVDNFRRIQLEETETLCTYCVDSPVVAVKTCLQCEASFCNKHLMAHNNNHVLIDPTLSISGRMCSIHKRFLEYYCSEDNICLCAICCLVGEHKGHQVEPLQKASEEKQEKLRNALQKLIPKSGTVEENLQSLQDHKVQVQIKADGEKKRVTDLFQDITRQVEIHEKSVLSELSRKEEQILALDSDQIQKLNTVKAELSQKMDHVKKMCDMTDPFTVLQDPETDTDDDPHVEEPSTSQLDDFPILLVLHNSIIDLIRNIKSQVEIIIKDGTDLQLDSTTADDFVALSDDLKTATSSDTSLNRPDSQERFTKYKQVLSMKRYSAGRHFWEVEVGNSGEWEVGMCYPSIKRTGEESCLGHNEKSWTFRLCKSKYSANHNSQEQQLNPQIDCQRFGIYLDYKAGCLSFYQLGDSISHLHTFTATFTEPLHAAIWVHKGAWVKITN
ncbi:E3 ubiquitin-protein ligase TRIM39-like [Hyperolius riggenbachi]|uniref:E3 ubiquitin-protein ligase TRIM39-like n=1 Tax=Hyperolius riggenbachi TaxID=752182 RepID=UPI0035A37C13